MSINIQAKTNYSFLFSGLSSSASNALSGNWLADYASIKNGSYGKLMKAYYAKDSGDSKTAASTITKKDTATDTAKKALAKVETTTDALKESADALLATGKRICSPRRISLPKMRMVWRVPPRGTTLMQSTVR